jgi:hypothetical protein
MGYIYSLWMLHLGMGSWGVDSLATEDVMTQYARHVEKKGPIYPIDAIQGDYPWFATTQFLLPRAEYRLCTEQGVWLPEWKDVTQECQLSMNENGTCSIWHRSARMRSATDVLHPCHASRYKVTVDPTRGSICIEERV